MDLVIETSKRRVEHRWLKGWEDVHCRERVIFENFILARKKMYLITDIQQKNWTSMVGMCDNPNSKWMIVLAGVAIELRWNGERFPENNENSKSLF